MHDEACNCQHAGHVQSSPQESLSGPIDMAGSVGRVLEIIQSALAVWYSMCNLLSLLRRESSTSTF